MATLIKKKFIGNDQIDGDKILLLEGQDIRRIVDGSEVDVIADLEDQILDVESSIAQEVIARLAGDVASQTYTNVQIANLVGTAPAILDTIHEIAAALQNEQSTTTTILSQLVDHENRIDSLESKTWFKKKITINSTHITNGYVDLDHTAVAGSVSAFVDRLAIHEGASEDYTLSIVAGKTRVTLLNQLIAPGLQALDVSDNLYFKYQY
jgi:hypothetical protein